MLDQAFQFAVDRAVLLDPNCVRQAHETHTAPGRRWPLVPRSLGRRIVSLSDRLQAVGAGDADQATSDRTPPVPAAPSAPDRTIGEPGAAASPYAQPRPYAASSGDDALNKLKDRVTSALFERTDRRLAQ